MPKKTKKEKALAQARRLIQNAHIQTSTEVPHIIQTKQPEIRPISSFEFKAKPIPTTVSKLTESDKQEFTAIRKDIIKTIALASIAIAFEFIVYLKLG